MKLSFLPILALVGLSACATAPKSKRVPSAPQPRAELREVSLKPTDVKRVRTPEFVKTYHLGRSVRGRNGKTMHEARRVYRLEKPSRWNLRRDQPPLASTGPVNKIVDSAYKSAPQSKEIQAELNHQRELSARLEEAHAELVDAVDKARGRLAATVEGAGEIKSLRSELKRLRSENESLKRSQSDSIPLPDVPATPPAERLKKWGEQLDADKS